MCIYYFCDSADKDKDIYDVWIYGVQWFCPTQVIFLIVGWGCMSRTDKKRVFPKENSCMIMDQRLVGLPL